MDSSRVSQLSERQKTCLRLVWMHRGSKDIAVELGISPHTVDDHIRAAMRALSTSSRRDAARIVAEFEHLPPPQRLMPQSLGMPSEAASSPQRVSAEMEKPDADAGFPIPVPTRRRPKNDLTIVQRLGWIIAITAMSIFALGVLLAGLVALSQVTGKY